MDRFHRPVGYLDSGGETFIVSMARQRGLIFWAILKDSVAVMSGVAKNHEQERVALDFANGVDRNEFLDCIRSGFMEYTILNDLEVTRILNLSA